MTEISPPPFSDDPSVYRTLLESTRAIPWRIDWQTMTFSYIGPQIEALLGWPQDSWKTVEDWATRMHEEDRDRVLNFCVSQSESGIDHEADYRALTADGGYVWIRDVVHVIRKDDQVEALVGFMFDITERKETEERLLRLQQELEELSFRDGLTGVANRRMFDQTLKTEWASARRTGEPLSLLMIDIDFFKQYNDHYGHLAGDDCLRRVAECIASVAQRPRDLVARFGGEEFFLVLPATAPDMAVKLAEECRQQIQALGIPNAGAGEDKVLTVSIGVTSRVPTEQDNLLAFIDQADRLLYKAKQSGRDQAVSSWDAAPL